MTIIQMDSMEYEKYSGILNDYNDIAHKYNDVVTGYNNVITHQNDEFYRMFNYNLDVMNNQTDVIVYNEDMIIQNQIIIVSMIHYLTVVVLLWIVFQTCGAAIFEDKVEKFMKAFKKDEVTNNYHELKDSKAVIVV